MTDDLRTRIAKELFNRFGGHLGYADAPWEGVEQQSWLEDADAVIEALDEFYEDSLQSTVFSAKHLLEQHSTPRHFTQGELFDD